MKLFNLSLIISALLLSANISFAQYSAMISGRIIDGKNKPIPGAKIKVSNKHTVDEYTSDQDGIYYTRLLEEGGYWIDVYANGKCFKTKKIFISSTDRTRKYYNFRVEGNKLSSHTEEKDPYFTEYLKSVRDAPVKWNLVDGPNGKFTVVKQDTSGYLQPKYGSGTKVPKRK